MPERNDESYPGARVELAQRIPLFAQRVLIVGDGRVELAAVLKRRGVREVYGIASGALPPANAGPFDAVVFADSAACLDALPQMLEGLTPFLAANGYALLVVPNARCWRAQGAGVALEDLCQRVAAAGLGVYMHYTAWDGEHEAAQPDEDGVLTLGGTAYRVGSAEECDALLATDYLIVAVVPAYNPVDHARALLEAGHPDWAFEVLSAIPEAYLQDPRVLAVVSTDMMLCLVKMEQRGVEGDRLERFVLSQQLFYRAVFHEPLLHFAYQCQAEFWHLVGNDDMAARLLRSIEHVAPDESTRAQLERYVTVAQHTTTDLAPPDWRPPSEPPRVLFVLHPRPHYGIDVLFDGLCSVLGDERVVDFPWKPWLHGQAPERLRNYPCTLERRGEAVPLDDVVRRLEAGWFDVVLYGDLEQDLEQAAARRIMAAAGDVPVFLVDALDECHDTRPEALERLGLSSVAGLFKREMLACVDHGPNVYPLPFAYLDGRIPADVSGPRTERLFWAGHREFGLRRLYLERLEAVLGRRFEREYSPEEYARALGQARIGLNIFGFGFDTVRYWEIPAHGCMLLSERPPIRIPHNFRDGESAVFFDDLADLEEKLAYYLAHPEESRAIAVAGHEHLKQYHTASARAGQALAWMETGLGR